METPVSLLERMRMPADHDAWAQFVELYTPLLFAWARRLGQQEGEAADLVQELLLLLVRKLPEFTYDRNRSFRGWLRTIARNHWLNLRRRSSLPIQPGEVNLDGLADADPAEAFWEAEYRRHLAARALDLMRAQFQPTTWAACWATVVEGKPAATVAAELNISPGAVYVARSRVLSRLRQELDGLFD